MRVAYDAQQGRAVLPGAAVAQGSSAWACGSSDVVCTVVHPSVHRQSNVTLRV